MPALPDRQGAAAALTPPLPAGADLVVCLDTERVWGVLGAGETVTITVNGVQMGAAHSDGIGFFWTTLYDADGQRPGLGSGDVVAIHHDGMQAASVTLRSISGQLDTLTDIVSGDIGGTGHPISVTVYAPWGEPSTASYSQTVSTDGSGHFGADLSALWDSCVWDEPVVAYVDSGVEIHRVVYPSASLLIRAEPRNQVMGYTAPGTSLTATVYLSDHATVVQSSTFTADSASGWYLWNAPSDILVGDIIDVQLDGGTLLTRTVDPLTMDMDPANDRITGIAMPASTVRGRMSDLTPQGWREVQTNTTADAATGAYTLDFSSLADIMPGTFASVHVADGEGDDQNVRGQSASVEVNQTWDNVQGYASASPGPHNEGQPVTLTLYSAASAGTTTYSKTMDWWGSYWFDQNDGLPDIAAGDAVTVTSTGWEGVVQVRTMTAQHDLDAEQISGTVEAPTSRAELSGGDWEGRFFPLGGQFDMVVTATGGVWMAAPTGFDLNNHLNYDVGHRTDSHYLERITREPDWIGVMPGGNAVVGNVTPPGTAYTITLLDAAGSQKAQRTGVSQEPMGRVGWLSFWDDGAEIAPGDKVQVQSAAGFSQTVVVPYLAVLGDADTDVVHGQAPPNVLLDVYVADEGEGFVPVDGSGHFTVAVGQLQGAQGDGDLEYGTFGGAEYFDENRNWVWCDLDWPWVRVNYAHDWVGGDYAVSRSFWITVTDSISVPKASAVVSSTYGGGWGGAGFETQGDDWSPSQPDIEPGDWVLVRSDDGFYNVMQIGTITGTVDADNDSVTGRVYAEWFTETLDVEAHVWECCGAPNKSSTAAPDGSVPYFCQWDPGTEWDVLRGHQIAVMYIEPDGDRVINTFRDPRLDLLMRVNYGHDWVEGHYVAGHTLWITVTESFTPNVKATAELTTGVIPWWGAGESGFSTNLGDPWVPSRPDIQPGDRVFGTVDNGYSSTVRIGTITGELDVDADIISGTIDANWFTDTLNGNCGVWEPGGPGIDFTVDPDGGSYSCDFGAVGWDLLPGQNVGVQYEEPDEDYVINVFRGTAPDLRVEKWVEGYEAAAGGMAVYGIRYRNEGDGVAGTVMLTDTLPLSATYVADSSGVTPTLGAGWVSWELGPLDPHHEEWFQLALSNTASPSDTLRNVVDIHTANDSDPGDDHAEAEMHVGDGQPDVYVNKWSEPGDPAPGQTFLYQINCGNYGPVASGPVLLTDTLPLSTTFVSWHSEKGYALWTEVVTSGGQVVLSAPAIPGHWEDRIKLRLRVDEGVAAGTQITNTIEVHSAVDSNPDNNRQVHDQTWVGEPRWGAAIEKRFEWGRLVPGGEIEYWVQFSNRGNMAAQTWISDTLPEGTSFQGATWRESERVWPSFEPSYVDDQVVAWDLGLLEPGDWPGFRIRLDIGEGITPDMEITNCVQIALAGEDEQLYEQVSCQTNRVNQPGANLRLRKRYSWEGDGRIRYDIDLWNVGTEDLHDVRITDTYPLSTTWDGSSWTWGPGFHVDHDPGQRQLVFSTDYLGASWTGGVGFRVELDSEVIGIPGMAFTNTVQAPVPGDVYADDNYDEVVAYSALPAPDVEVEKWVEGNGAAHDGPVVFTIRCYNHGNGVAEAIVVTDTLQNTSYITDSSGVQANVGAGVVSWTLPPLDPGHVAQFQIVLSHTASASDTVRNQVDIHVPNDSYSGNHHAEAEVHITDGQPDLWVDKSSNPGDPAPGQTFLYEIDYGNNGPVASGEVLLTDTLPVSTSLVSWYSGNGYNLWTEVLSTSNRLVLSAPAVPGYWGDRIRLRLRVDSDAAGGTQLTNTVEIRTAGDTDPSNDQDTYDSTWVGQPRWNARSQKRFLYARLTPGGETSHFLEFGNRGNMPGHAWITDTLPEGTTFYEAKRSAGGLGWVPCPPTSVTDRTVSWDLGVLEPGDWRTYWVRTMIEPGVSPGTVITNCVSITIEGPDEDPDDNSACITDVVREAGPNLRVEKRYWWEGDGRIGYAINYWNLGTDDLAGVCLTDTYPVSTTWTGSTWTWGPSIDVTHDAGNRQLVFCVQNAYLNASDHGGIDFRVDLEPEIVGRPGMVFTNTVEAPITGDVYPDDNYDEVVADTGPVVGYTNVDLVRDYNGESNVGNLVTDGMLWKADLLDDGELNGSVELCFTNPGGLRTDIIIPEGASLPYPISWQNTFDLMPFGNTLLLMDLTGAQIQELLDQAATLFKGILQSAGISWYWSNNCQCGSPTSWGAFSVTVNGEPLDPGRTYRLVTNEWLAAGGDGWVTFADGTNRWDTGYLMQEAVNEYIGWYNAAVGPIDYQVEGRIRLVDTLYVDTVTGSDAGNYCRDAVAPCQTVGHALSQAVNGSSIGVSAGVYDENLTVSRTVELKGGYEAAAWTRDLALFETVLDGTASGGTVVLFVPGSSGAALDGFTVTDGDEGGVAVDGASVAIASCQITSNTNNVNWGGGVYATNGASVLIHQTAITDNVSGSAGGLGLMNGAAVTLVESIVSGNSTTWGAGGGIGAWWGATLTVSDSIIQDNTTASSGGGIHLSDGATLERMTNSLVVGNQATSGGAGVDNNSSNATLMNVTLADNVCSAGGGCTAGLSNRGAEAVVTITNSILASNDGDDLQCDEGTCTVSSSDIGEGLWPGTGNISADPDFVDPLGGDYRLQSVSPCIDQGTPAGAPPHDIEGTPRDATPDMGAYEFVNYRPRLGTVDPSTGSGPTGVTTYFTTTWKDANGWQDLKQCYFHIGASPSIVGNVTLMYNAARNKLWLRNDAGTAWTGGYAPGSANVLQNSQAIVHCDLTAAHGSGDTLGVTWAIEFKPSYTGTKKLGLKCKDRGKARAKGKWKGTWTITP
jgi:uncharacterized repeat protein (TIGR01451 family)